ncbi:MAG: amidohydrolase [Armatimonadetes bacterium]|nr:amidohydrolase [Armatimonadota bacterium]
MGGCGLDRVMERVVTLRRDFHQHPELGCEEHRTAGIVARRLTELGLTPRTGVGGTGVTAVIEGQAGPGPTLLLRADMDALAVTEEADVPFASVYPGKMHACGHDGHTAILLGVAECLCAHTARLRGRVKLAFQPNEEGVQGALAMIADGLLDDPPVDMALGLHLWAGTPVGEIALAAGPIMACADRLEIVVRGRGGHASAPWETIDPVVAAAHIITALQTVVSRNVRADRKAVVTITQVAAGDTHNVIAERATLIGTIRSFEPETTRQVRDRVRAVATGVAAALGAEAEVTITEGPPPVVNDADLTSRVRAACLTVAGADQVIAFEPVTGGEDFACIAQQVPSCFFFVGARNEGEACDQPHHHPRFKIDEGSLTVGLRAMLASVDHLLGA